ncbi:MAG: helix-turn-helix domain-containing protein [Vulcanimicrobiota bacterium]
MERVHSLSEKREEKIVQSVRDFIDDVMEGGAGDEELDRRLEAICQKWEQHKESEGMTMVAEKLYTPAEVAQHLGLAEKTIRDFLRADTIHGVKVGKEWRVRERDLQGYIDGLNGTGKK